MAKRIELKNSGVFFNEEAHEYWLGDKQLSGITGMLQRQLFPDEFNGIIEATLNAAAEYGTGVHSSIAILWISSISITTLSPGMHISVPSGSFLLQYVYLTLELCMWVYCSRCCKYLTSFDLVSLYAS